jgi:hypothetical protein
MALRPLYRVRVQRMQAGDATGRGRHGDNGTLLRATTEQRRGTGVSCLLLISRDVARVRECEERWTRCRV